MMYPKRALEPQAFIPVTTESGNDLNGPSLFSFYSPVDSEELHEGKETVMTSISSLLW